MYQEGSLWGVVGALYMEIVDYNSTKTVLVTSTEISFRQY